MDGAEEEGVAAPLDGTAGARGRTALPAPEGRASPGPLRPGRATPHSERCATSVLAAEGDRLCVSTTNTISPTRAAPDKPSSTIRPRDRVGPRARARPGPPRASVDAP